MVNKDHPGDELFTITILSKILISAINDSYNFGQITQKKTYIWSIWYSVLMHLLFMFLELCSYFKLLDKVSLKFQISVVPSNNYGKYFSDK